MQTRKVQGKCKLPTISRGSCSSWHAFVGDSFICIQQRRFETIFQVVVEHGGHGPLILCCHPSLCHAIIVCACAYGGRRHDQGWCVSSSEDPKNLFRFFFKVFPHALWFMTCVHTCTDQQKGKGNQHHSLCRLHIWFGVYSLSLSYTWIISHHDFFDNNIS